jgi:hypothetical protein
VADAWGVELPKHDRLPGKPSHRLVGYWCR